MSAHTRLTALLVGAGLLAIPASASAGTYVVKACGASAQSANHSWTKSGTVPPVEISNGCGAGGGYGGLYVRERIGGTYAPLANNQAVKWTFAAPAGLTVSAVTYKRWLYKNDDQLHAGLWDATGKILDECTIVFPEGSCTVASAGGASRTISGLATSSLAVGVVCRVVAPATNCAAGGSAKSGFGAVLYDAAVTISDVGAPSVAAPSGDLLGGGWQHGLRTLSVGGSDASGISRAVVVIDGTEVAHADRPCDFTYAKPCSDATGAAVSVDTTKLSDGPHMVQGGVVDAAGNRTLSAPAAVQVDNTAPLTPEALHAPGEWQSSHQVPVSARVPAGQDSPVTTVRYAVCNDDGSCAQPQSQPVAGSTFSFTPTVPDGRHVVRLWLQDDAGNQDASTAAFVFVNVDTTAPAVPVSPAAQPDGRSALVTWKTPQDSGSPIVGALVQLCPDTGSCLPTEKTSSTSLRTPQLAAGHWTAKIWLADQVGNQDPAHPATTTFTIAPSGRRAAPHLRFSLTRRRGHRLALHATLARTATGKLTVTVLARDRLGHGMRPLRRRVSIKHGRAATTIKLSSRARRVRVSVRYAGNSRLMAQTRTTRVRRLS